LMKNKLLASNNDDEDRVLLLVAQAIEVVLGTSQVGTWRRKGSILRCTPTTTLRSSSCPGRRVRSRGTTHGCRRSLTRHLRRRPLPIPMTIRSPPPILGEGRRAQRAGERATAFPTLRRAACEPYRTKCVDKRSFQTAGGRNYRYLRRCRRRFPAPCPEPDKSSGNGTATMLPLRTSDGE